VFGQHRSNLLEDALPSTGKTLESCRLQVFDLVVALRSSAYALFIFSGQLLLQEI